MTDEPAAVDVSPGGEPTLEYERSDGESLVEAVVTAVAAVSDVDATDLPPLYAAVDPEALAAVVESVEGAASVAFEYGTRDVVIDGDRTVSVY